MKDKSELNSNAILLRKKLGEDIFSPIDVFGLIKGIEDTTLVFYPMSEQISGMCVRIDHKDSLIAINSNSTYGRQRFTASHELYHLNFQPNFKNVVCSKDLEGPKEEEEKNADAFASYFLAPYEALKIFISETLKKDKDSLSINDIVRIEQHFGMSRQATLYRLLNDRYIDPEKVDEYKTNVIQSARKLGFDEKLYYPSPENEQYMTMGAYIVMVEKLKENGIISNGKYKQLLIEAYRADIAYNLKAGEPIYD